MSARGATTSSLGPFCLAPGGMRAPYPAQGCVGPAEGCGGPRQRGPHPNPCHGSEVRHIISNLGIDGLAEEELDEMIAEVDPDGSGVINYKEFVKRIFAPIPPVSAA